MFFFFYVAIQGRLRLSWYRNVSCFDNINFSLCKYSLIYENKYSEINTWSYSGNE